MKRPADVTKSRPVTAASPACSRRMSRTTGRYSIRWPSGVDDRVVDPRADLVDVHGVPPDGHPTPTCRAGETRHHGQREPDRRCLVRLLPRPRSRRPGDLPPRRAEVGVRPRRGPPLPHARAALRARADRRGRRRRAPGALGEPRRRAEARLGQPRQPAPQRGPLGRLRVPPLRHARRRALLLARRLRGLVREGRRPRGGVRRDRRPRDRARRHVRGDPLRARAPDASFAQRAQRRAKTIKLDPARARHHVDDAAPDLLGPREREARRAAPRADRRGRPAAAARPRVPERRRSRACSA